MSSPDQLVEHYFRHEYGRLVALLTKSIGVRNMHLAEDAVQASLTKALVVWARRGVPPDPSAWLYRTAKHQAIDVLRRNQIAGQALEKLSERTSAENSFELGAEDLVEDEVGDEPLRMLFLCCHPSIALESRLAVALKMVGGFHVREIASSLLISQDTAEKRIARAKEKLRESGIELTQLDWSECRRRMDSVLATIYLLFNEGYAATSGAFHVRKDLCDEALRLGRMICNDDRLVNTASCALLSLICMHSARFQARTNADGSIILLEDQDRSLWNWELIREGMKWMSQSATGDDLSRYHVESAIAWEHCRAASFSQIDWPRVKQLYGYLVQLHGGPMVKLNWAIAVMYAESPQQSLLHLLQMEPAERARLRPWWDCSVAEAYYQTGRNSEAIAHWNDALALANNAMQRELIKRKINSIKV